MLTMSEIILVIICVLVPISESRGIFIIKNLEDQISFNFSFFNVHTLNSMRGLALGTPVAQAFSKLSIF